MDNVIFILVLTICGCLFTLVNAQDGFSLSDTIPAPEDTLIPLLVDTPINSSFLSLSRIFPFGVNFSMTSLTFLSRKFGYTEPSLAFYLDAYTATLRSQESLARYLGGVFVVKVKKFAMVINETGIETVDELRVFVVDKSHALKLTVKQNVQQVENTKIEMLRLLRNSVNWKGDKLTLVPERVRYSLPYGNVVDLSQAELCFYAVQAPGFPLVATEILPKFQVDLQPLLQIPYEKYKILQITTCTTGDQTSAYKLDALSIGLLVLAIVLSITLVGAIIFICCWIRMKKLHATVVSATSAHSMPAESVYSSKVSYYQNGHFPAAAPWPFPAYPYGIYDVQLPPKRGTLPSSCDVNYEWQESTMDLAMDADSLTQGSVLNLNTSSSVPSLTEDTPTRNTPSPEPRLKSAFSENTNL